MSVNEKYVMWEEAIVERAFDAGPVRPPKGVEDFELNGGESLAARWKKPGTAELVNGDPKRPALVDCVRNLESLRIVSARAKAVLEAARLADVEFLPLSLTFKKKPIGVDCFIVNCTRRFDVLDAAKSGAKRAPSDGRVLAVKRIVLSDDPARPLFQLEGYESGYLVSVAVAEQLAAAKLGGFRWMTLANFPGGVVGRSPFERKIDALNTQHFEADPIALSGR